MENRFVECNSQKHSANNNGTLRKKIFFSLENRFAECKIIILCRVYFVKTLSKPFDECAIKNTRQIVVCQHCRCRVLFAECYTRQSLCRVFFGLCRVPVAHGKLTVSGSGRCTVAGLESTPAMLMQSGHADNVL